jgi:hypothetical protein
VNYVRGRFPIQKARNSLNYGWKMLFPQKATLKTKQEQADASGDRVVDSKDFKVK